MTARQPAVDWPGVWEDFALLGITTADLARRVPYAGEARLLQIAGGRTAVRRAESNTILRLWSELTGKPADFAPRLAATPGQQRPVQHLAEPGVHEPCLAQREALEAVWAQIVKRG